MPQHRSFLLLSTISRKSPWQHLLVALLLAIPAIFFGWLSAKADTDVSSIIRFARLSDLAALPETKDARFKYKEWQPHEIELVRPLIAEIEQKAPGLIKCASYGSPIFLLRATTLVQNKEIGQSPSARAGNEVIYIADQFFEKRYSYYKLHCLMHELVHQADDGSLIAYSPEWVKFFVPTMNELSQRYPRLKPEEKRSFAELYEAIGVSPSEESTDALQEGLAEFFTASRLENFDPGPSYKQFFDRMLAPPATDAKYRSLFKEGGKQLSLANYSKAITAIKSAAQIVPDNPVPAVELAAIYRQQNDWKNCAHSAEEAVKKFRAANIPSSDPNYQWTEKTAMYALWMVQAHK